MDSIVLGAGERFDVVIQANQEINSYWMRFHGLTNCIPPRIFQGAILRYNGAADMEPEEMLTYENTERFGKVCDFIKLRNHKIIDSIGFESNKFHSWRWRKHIHC